ncbi:MAG: hypothetical protein BMS9Abin19_0484 [Gammaproteobacteria bacterium]|nr:MAG: hypothetical protein BMS9Abin19_0484 [Gammaproteobacteria bacterium]
MNFGRQKNIVTFVAAGLCFFSQAVFAVLFEPGAGVGLDYTDNSTLVNENKLNDLVTVGYVGARLSENEGALMYDTAAAYNNTSYTQNTFPDRGYLNLQANADWEMVKEQFNWLLSDSFTQRRVVTLNSNTPDNLQDSNIFTFGANIRSRISARQNFSLTPIFKHYYYEVQRTNNKQYSLVANWNYQMFRLTSVGFNLSARKVDYTEKNLSGQPIIDNTFKNMAIIINGQRLRSVFAINLGATNVKRGNGQDNTGFTGYLNWLADISSRSKFETLVSTDITDTSRLAFSLAGDPIDGSGNDVQITANVVRNSLIRLAYLREDATWRTSIAARYRKLKYSDDPLDRIIRDFDLRVRHPVTQLLSSGAYANYNRSRELDTNRLDESFTVGGDLKYLFSRKLHGLLYVRYRRKKSDFVFENYSEYSAFVSLVYGFGSVRRP